MPNINNLIADIDTVLLSGMSEPPVEIIRAFGERVASLLSSRLIARTKHYPFTLRMSNLGKSESQLWYEAHGYEKDEEMGAQVLLKFLYGDIIEELLLTLAEVAGHEVTDRQKEVELDGIKGHIDTLIDGELVDVKSASSISFNKFQEGTLRDSDPFGYYTQLSGYATSLGKTNGYFLAMDKTLGYTCLLEMKPEEVVDMHSRIPHLREVLQQDTAPPCGCTPKVEKNGNECLTAQCSYNPYKHHAHPGLRTFLYSTGPRFFTKVVKQPEVLEVTKVA